MGVVCGSGVCVWGMVCVGGGVGNMTIVFFLETPMRASNFGGRTPGSQIPGVPATPEPSMTKNSSSSRAHLALNVPTDGARQMPQLRASITGTSATCSPNCNCGISR